MWELVQVTAQYSHAVLLAVLPYISGFSVKLDLPVAVPVTTNQVVAFKCDPRLGQTGGALTLADGTQFTFLDGRVCIYRSPKSYFSLQDPALIPQFFGPVKVDEKSALKTARAVILKLGYKNSVFNADSAPLVTRPEPVGTNFISRYRFQWADPDRPISNEAGAAIPSLLDIEVNASNGAVEMVVISSRDTRRPSPTVDVVPQLLHSKTNGQQLLGGRQTAAVSAAYADAFLNTILPQLSAFISSAGLNLPTPVTTNQIVRTNYLCRILNGQPIAQLYFTNGDRFNYRQGYFSAFYAHDAFMKFPQTGASSDFLGHINMTTNEAITLCEAVMRKLGYVDKFPVPTVSYAQGSGSLAFTRYTYYWRHLGQDNEFASFEVDMEHKTIKSIYLKDPVFERPPPRIDVLTNQ
jgi:hypothetical protein